MARVGVVLSGCGVYDGAEIHEAVLTMLALDEAGAEIMCMAPKGKQLHVIDHAAGAETGEERDIFVESARIARGDITDLAAVQADDLDAIVFPGGFGAAKNLCNFAVAGAECEVDPGVAALVREVHAQGKPVAAVCIAPALLAKVLGEEGPELTIGNDAGTAGALETLGATHVECPVTEFVVDRDRKLITSPAYMLAQNISEASEGITKTVDAMLEMA